MNPDDRQAQPGLIVRYDNAPPLAYEINTNQWRPSHDDLSQSYHGTPEPKTFTSNGYEALEHENANGSAHIHTGDEEGRQPPARRAPWLLFGLGGLAVFILAGVIGGVVGWRVTAAQNQQKPTGPSPNIGNTPPTNASKIVVNSALTAVGWRFGADITLHVFFQGPDKALRRMQYQTIYQNWTAPMEVNAAPNAGSAFAANHFWVRPEPLPVIPQAELFYIGSPDKILGVNWREGFSRGGLSDSVNDGGYTTTYPDTQMAAYWPSTILQDINGNIMETFFDYKSPRFQEPKRTGVTASLGSALVMLPREVLHSSGDNTAASSSARIIYRDANGRLRNFDRSSNGQDLPSSGQLPVTVDANFTMAGFAVARLNSAGQKEGVNTWVLYQDSKTGKISYVYEDDTTGWNGPKTDAVFDGADNPTHLACVTAGSATVPEVPLEAAHDLSHCFFQVDRKLKHVHFDGNTWTDMGILPIP